LLICSKYKNKIINEEKMQLLFENSFAKYKPFKN